MKFKFEIDTDNTSDLVALRDLIDVFMDFFPPIKQTAPPSDETIMELLERKASETEERMAQELSNPIFSPG
jgi:hypothetical protein